MKKHLLWGLLALLSACYPGLPVAYLDREFDAGALTDGSPTSDGGPFGLPCEVEALFRTRCASCHGLELAFDAPMALVTYEDLLRPSPGDPAQTSAELSLSRMVDGEKPMPPSGVPPTSEVAALQGWINQGYPQGSCTPGSVDAGPDPFAAAARCSTESHWTSGDRGSPLMHPGRACIACHRQAAEGPSYSLAGTVYPTAHEPDECNGASASTGAKVVVTPAGGTPFTLTPNAAGNFFSRTPLAFPVRVKVTYQGRERVMNSPVTSGDCNGCHTQSGAQDAPGRILLP